MGSLLQYNLLPVSTPGADGQPDLLDLSIKPRHEWLTLRQASWPESAYLPANVEETPTKDQHPDRWMMKIEIVTHTPNPRPLWNGPQFTFKTFSDALESLAHASPHAGSLGLTFTEQIPSQVLVIKQGVPIPFLEGRQDDVDRASLGQILNPSPPSIPEAQIRNNIHRAMATEMRDDSP
jgi:hypothetical protein